MRALAVALAACVLLGACAAAGGLNTPHAVAERAETAAELAYQGAAPLLTSAQKAKAWDDLMEVRRLYNAGLAIDGAVTVLQADLPKGSK